MQQGLILTNFTGGEQSEKILGRVDMSKYANGCVTLENFMVLPQGGVTRRHGFRFINQIKDSTKKAIKVPFRYSVAQEYSLEFGEYYMRVYKDDGVVVKTSLDTADWATGTVYAVGSFVLSGGLIYRCITAHTSSAAFATDSAKWIQDATYEIVTPYTTASLPSLQFIQRADILFVLSESYLTKEISRLGHNSWAIADFAHINGPFLKENETTKKITLSAIAGSTGKYGDSITVTATAATFVASDVGRLIKIRYIKGGKHIAGGNTDPSAAYTSSAYAVNGKFIFSYSFANGDGGNRENYLEYSVDDGTTWAQYQSLIGTSTTQEISGELRSEDYNYVIPQMRWTTTGNTDVCYWSLRTEKEEVSGVLKITGFTSSTVVTCTVLRDASYLGIPSTLWSLGAWSVASGYPRAATFFEDRFLFGGVAAQPQTIWGSKNGDYVNFETGVADDDALDFSLVSDNLNTILWLNSKDNLVVGTAGSEWVVTSTNNSPLTPTNIKAKRVSSYGSDEGIAGVLTNNALVYTQRGSQNRARMFNYDYQSDSYFSTDLNLLASHITQFNKLTGMDFSANPEPYLWFVRDDGVAPLLTLMSDQDVIAWSRQITDGLIESIACLTDATYFIIKRGDVRTVEMLTVWDETLAGSYFLDSYLLYDGVATSTLSGLEHLEGKTVSVVSEGLLLGSNYVVTNGAISLGTGVTVTKACVGLPYTSKIKTNPLDMLTRVGTSQGYLKRITKATARLYKTIKGKIGYSDAKVYALGTKEELFTGDKEALFPQGYEKQAYVYIEQTEPYPMTVTAIMVQGEVMEL